MILSIQCLCLPKVSLNSQAADACRTNLLSSVCTELAKRLKSSFRSTMIISCAMVCLVRVEKELERVLLASIGHSMHWQQVRKRLWGVLLESLGKYFYRGFTGRPLLFLSLCWLFANLFCKNYLFYIPVRVLIQELLLLICCCLSYSFKSGPGVHIVYTVSACDTINCHKRMRKAVLAKVKSHTSENNDTCNTLLYSSWDSWITQPCSVYSQQTHSYT